MKTIETYASYNQRRYGKPWVTIVSPETGKLDFSQDIGGYTAAPGEAGELFVANPQEGAVYAYGQKDYRGNGGGYEYAKFVNGEFVPVAKTELISALS